MILVVLVIGAILIVSAMRNTYGALFTALGQDVPHFVVWAAAIVAVGAIGFIPGLKPISRGLLALVIIVLIFQNYANILKGFQAVSVAPKVKNPNAGNDNVTITAKPYNPADYGYITPPSAFGS